MESTRIASSSTPDCDRHGVFWPAKSETLDTIAEYNRRGVVNMMFATCYINAESAKVAYLLSRKLSKTREYVSFFANAAIEALSGAIKLVRHHSVRHKKANDGAILFVTTNDVYRTWFDPAGSGPLLALAPNIWFVRSVEAALESLASRAWAGVVLVQPPVQCDATLVADLKRLRERTQTANALFVYANVDLEIDDELFLAPWLDADVYVFGESTSERQVPFGCFVMSPDAYSVWNNSTDSIAHTSTFGGNGVCLAVVERTLRRHDLIDSAEERVLTAIDSCMDDRLEYFHRYVNPATSRLYRITGYDLEIASGRGMRLKLGDGRELFDLAGGSGASLRGHNPPDLPAELAQHSRTQDYLATLEAQLKELSHFDRVIPAVSGATAVDLAVAMAMLANPERSKIVTFRGNYSGKTLLAMNLSKHSAMLTESDRDAFRPYYHGIVYIDPDAPDAAASLRRVLEKGDVGLVWFEMVQGYAAKPIPDELLQIINSLKRSHGFLVGVDEVFTGVWRVGRFLCHEGRVDSDVTVLSKPLSDITVPMAAVLARESVYRRACKRGPEWVRFMEGYFRNQLGAHVASHALAKVTAEGHMRARQAKDEPFVTFAKVSSAFGPVLGRGYVSRLSLNPRYFPFTARSTIRQLLELGLSSLIREKAGVLLLNLRFFQPIFGDRNDLQEAIRRVERVVQEIKPWTVYAYTVALLLLSGSRRSLARLNAFVARRRTEVQAGLETTEVSRGR